MEKKDFRVVKQNGTLPPIGDIDMTGIETDLWDAYVESSNGLLGEVESAAMALERGELVEDNAAAIKRILHTVKGEAGMTGMKDVCNLCHEAEGAFIEFIEANDAPKAADMVLKVIDWIRGTIDYVSNHDHQAAQAAEEAKVVKKPKALVIDDDEICRAKLNKKLLPFFDLTFAFNGKEGHKKYAQALDAGEPFKLVTLDINMPEMDGHECLAAIRDHENKKGIEGLDGVKIIMTTSREASKDVFGAFRKGCEAYVVKSHLDEKLLDEIAKLGLLKVTKVEKSYAAG